MENFKFLLLRLSSLDWDSQISFKPRTVISVILNQISRKELTRHYWLSSLYSALPLPRQGRTGCWLFSLWHLLLWLKASCSFRTTGVPRPIWARQGQIFYPNFFDQLFLIRTYWNPKSRQGPSLGGLASRGGLILCSAWSEIDFEVVYYIFIDKKFMKLEVQECQPFRPNFSSSGFKELWSEPYLVRFLFLFSFLNLQILGVPEFFNFMNGPLQAI